jgi:hypothetical protein
LPGTPDGAGISPSLLAMMATSSTVCGNSKQLVKHLQQSSVPASCSSAANQGDHTGLLQEPSRHKQLDTQEMCQHCGNAVTTQLLHAIWVMALLLYKCTVHFAALTRLHCLRLCTLLCSTGSHSGCNPAP